MKVNIGPYPDDDKTERVIEVQIDDYDTWDAENTLAHIIHPVLVRFYESENGTPGELSEEEWKCALQQMIASFEMIKNTDGYFNKKQLEYVEEGLQLFAKYYLYLWN